jgi:mannose-6-phosphate isomerase
MLIHGFKDAVDAARVMEYLGKNRLEELLAYVPVQSGDVVFVPAGTVHAIMKGIVLAEIQENSDITYRLYDWGRTGKGRDLHIAQSLQVSELKSEASHKIPRLTIHHPGFDQHYLIACHYFLLELDDIQSPIRHLSTGDRFQIVSILQGAVEIITGESSVTAKQGQTLILPAQMGAFDITPSTTLCQILRAYIPDLRQDVIEPLFREGHTPTDIARLGGVTPEHNDLLPLLPRP